MFIFIRLKSFLVIFCAFIILTCIFLLPEIAIAAVGINQTVSFQGKLVNSDGTNVANGDYNLEFKIYQGGDGVPGGGDETLKWTETRTGSNKVAVTDGIFRVNLGSVTAFGTNVDWNQDTLWLSINVGGTGTTPSWDGEMSPFIRLTATPYAFNSQKVNGLTVTNTADNPFSSTTTLKIGDGKTVVLNNSITFSGTDGTTITFPNANDTVVVLDLAQTLTNKTIGSTGLVFSSASTDITTVSNQDLAIIPNGTGNVGIGLTNPVGKFAVSNASQTAIGKALVIFDQYEAQDLFTASSSGITKFVLSNSGNILLAAGSGIDSLTSGTIILGGGANTTGVTLGKAGGTLTLPAFTGNNAVLFATAGTGVLSAATTSTSGLCLLSGGGGYAPSWSACPVGGGGSSNWTLDSANGVLFPINNTLDILLGGTATSSAKFGFLNINSGIPTASISGNLSLAVPTGATPANQLNLLNGGSLTIRISPGGDTGLADALQITKGGSILATGNTTFGTTPTSGAGNRMMWIPAKAAFRAGRAGGTHWDDSNIGSYSVAFGESARASGTHSFATGNFTVASGNYSAAFGYGNTASGTYAFVAGGNNSTAAGSNSLVLGNLSTANNAGSIVIGERADSNANNAIVIGTGVNTLNHLNSTVANSLTIGFNSTVGTLFVGPGSGAGTYGNVGIGTNSIEGLFKVQGAKTGKALAIFDETGDQAIFTASKSGLTKFLIDNNGNVGIGTTVPSNLLDVVSVSDSTVDLSHISNTTGTSSSNVDGLQIDFQTSGTTVSVDNSGLRVNITRGNTGSSSTLEGIYIGDLGGGDHANVTTTALRIGTGWERGIVIESGGSTGEGFVYTGAGRPLKTITLSAEYPGAILTASGSATTIGTMISDASPSAALSNFQNYYEWSSSQSTLNDYTIAVRVTLPRDFSAWATTDSAIKIKFNTELTTTDSNKLDVLIYNTDISLSAVDQATPVVYRQANVSSTQKTWSEITISASELDSGANRDIDTGGETMVIYLKMYSKNNNYVQVGDIILNYLAKF
ncbi:MAG: hypothetical protein KatS3mg089_0885 [Patescibacteria group bacterium]|nr:MAG: hypothetical protein KatS3mg089_0885 [Patescibacteria group bacterium]